jgi:hypothetical protein
MRDIAPLKFNANDLVYGLYNGTTEALQRHAGGRMLKQIIPSNNHGNAWWTKKSIEHMEAAMKTGNKIHFNLTGIESMNEVLMGAGRLGNTITARELGVLWDRWSEFSNTVIFYQYGRVVPPPWTW